MKKNGELPAVSNNDKWLAKFNSGTLRITDTMRLMSLFDLLLENQLEFVLSFLLYKMQITVFLKRSC